jgi:SMC interacting uncharacterized protein involved in chromosome segregation
MSAKIFAEVMALRESQALRGIESHAFWSGFWLGMVKSMLIELQQAEGQIAALQAANDDLKAQLKVQGER